MNISTSMPSSSTLEHLFVYGTLAPGRANAHWLAPLEGQWRKAWINGTLLPQGWGAALGFPALIPDEQGERIEGLVFSSAQLGELWPALDEFEGEGYTRRLHQVCLEDGSSLKANLYQLNQSAL